MKFSNIFFILVFRPRIGDVPLGGDEEARKLVGETVRSAQNALETN